MGLEGFAKKAKFYLDTLCSIPGGRSVGAPGNRLATDLFAQEVRKHGFEVDVTLFDCLDFTSDGASLKCGRRSLKVRASPYSPGFDAEVKLVTVSTIKELEKCRPRGQILLMKGELCVEHLMPRNYPFFCPDNHKEIYALLDAKRPAAIITATGKNPALMGAVSPYPLFEDGDFDIPSAYCTESTGKKIAEMEGEDVHLTIDARRIPSTACNVIARKGPDSGKKITVCAHIDARPGMPGALDNASGTVVLMLLAEMLSEYKGKTGIELVAINGEEHYDACGEMDYLNRYGEDMDKVAVAVNVDGMGYVKGKTAYSFYGCSAGLTRKVQAAFKAYRGLAEGDQWFAGDHMVFAQAGRPAIALTSERALELAAKTNHTQKDVPALADPEKLVEAAMALADLINGMGMKA